MRRFVVAQARQHHRAEAEVAREPDGRLGAGRRRAGVQLKGVHCGACGAFFRRREFERGAGMVGGLWVG